MLRSNGGMLTYRALAKGVRQALREWESNKEGTQLRSNYLLKQKEFSKAVWGCKRKRRRDRNNRFLR